MAQTDIALFLGVAACGGLGAVVRFVLDTLIKRAYSSIFPLSTLIINTVAGFTFACALLLLQHNGETVYVLVSSGFLGGFSTFSTAMNEILNLARERHWKQCIVYLVLAVLLPVVAILLGIVLLQTVAGLSAARL